MKAYIYNFRKDILIFNIGLITLLIFPCLFFVNLTNWAQASGSKEMKHSNRLKNEKSPYLLQHADNPVDWYPWGEEAFEKARRENKPILLSIGYSTCHWCHVMEHESFEDEEVAKLMNDTFVSIKVDREERPDIDNIYMTVCQMMSKGGCGWPLNIIMTPDKKPFFAATYIPKESRYGRLGMIEFIPKVKEAWEKDNENILNSAQAVTEAVRKATDVSQNTQAIDLSTKTLDTAYNQLLRNFDEENGGFGKSPKFPTPHNHLFLLRYWKRTGDKQALGMVEKTLQEMRLGGMYDHVGFGFHRYSTDPNWLLPHFEKMLYDQAMLAMAYTEAYQATGKKEYEKTAREILTYVLRDMTSPEGGFYSAEDADSEGEEGKFYVWTEGELKETLGDKDAELIITNFNTSKSGNFTEEAGGHQTGANIMHLKKPLSEIAPSYEISEEEFAGKIEKTRVTLFNEREKRIHPYKDDKILTDWNGLMIAAFSMAGRTFNEPEYTNAASKAANFLLKDLRDSNGKLLHRFRNGDAGITANIDDYAFLIWGLLELYESTFDVAYLKAALALQDDLDKGFWDNKYGGYYFTSNDAEELISRQKEIYDGAIPSGNSVAGLNLLKLSRITGNVEYEKKADQLGKAFSETISSGPMAYTLFMMGLDFGLGPSYEVVIVGDPESEDTQSMIEAIRKSYSPSKVVLLRGKEENAEIIEFADFTKGQSSIDGKATAYVCLNHVCNLPTTDVSKMIELLSPDNS
ncbi:MAG: thioredoxin domain-containing protein [Thermodesulfobacteriota bacterium]|nr:MAG: thioredoxin domain-containing protein [Thermodesulfobacteriota bacterium]